jgi:hypothetical protein
MIKKQVGLLYMQFEKGDGIASGNAILFAAIQFIPF